MRAALFAALVCVSQARASQWDGEYWQYLNWTNWECVPYKLYTVAEARVNHDFSKFYYYRITENFAYQALSWLDLEAHYSFVYHESRGATHFKNTHRLEFEVNPWMRFDNGITLKWRNRFEFLKKQGVSHIQYVLRDRLLALFPFENCGRITAFKIYDEVFYDCTLGKVTQNRIVPIELTLKVNECTALDLFMMVRNFFGLSSHKWYRSIVIGSELSF